jgi:glycosyltransferase involved in cell wall biosynthesis
MQYGTPVIGANISSIPEIVGDGGILVDPLSTTSISEAMIILATDAERRQVLADNARRQAAKFSWEQAADETLAAFSAVIASSPERTDGK